MRGQVLHIRAASEGEAMGRVLAQFGSEAIIGEVKQVRKAGMAGLLGAREVEISVRVKPESHEPLDINKFCSLVKRIGHNIRTDLQAGYYAQWEAALRSFDVTGTLAENILAKVGQEPCTPAAAKTLLTEAIRVKKTTSRILMLAGPTGSGKTTTLAKLAIMKKRQKYKTALISLDTFRIGALEQLRTYAKIMDFPLIAVSSPSQLQEALEKLSACDAILLDTPGRSPKNQVGIAELKAFLDQGYSLDTALVVSATSKLEDLLQVYHSFSVLNPTSVIITRTDETTSIGSIATFSVQSGLPVSYLGTGQNVPNDLLIPDPQIMARWILHQDRPGSGEVQQSWPAD